MKYNVTLNCTFVMDTNRPDETGTDVVTGIRNYLNAWALEDIHIEDTIEEISIVCPRCKREVDDAYDLDHIEGYYGRYCDVKVCEYCRGEFDSVLEYEYAQARDSAEYQYERDGDW